MAIFDQTTDPFADLLTPEEQALEALGREVAPPVDLSVPDVNPVELPSAESFEQDMLEEEMVFGEGDPDLLAQDLAMPEEEMVFDEADPDLLPQDALPGELDAVTGADMAAGATQFASDMQLQEGMEDPRLFAAPPPMPGELADTALTAPEAPGLYTDEDLAEAAAQPAYEDMTDRALAEADFVAKQNKAELGRKLHAEGLAENERAKAAHLETREKHVANANQKIDRIYRDSKALGERGIDNERWWSSRSTGQQLALGLAAIISGQQGLMSGRGGNDTFAMMDKMIAADIASQKFEIQSGRRSLDQQEGLVAKLYQASGDLHEAQETARIATYNGLSADISAQMAAMDPEGTQFREMEMRKRQMAAAAGAAMKQVEKETRAEAIENFEFDVKVQENDRKEREMLRKEALANATLAKTAEDVRLLRRKGRGGPGRPKVKVGSVDEQAKLIASGYQPWKDASGLRVPAPGPEAAALRAKAPSDVKSQTAAAELRIKKQKAGELVVSDPSRKGAPFINEDGTVFEAKTTDERKRLTEKMGLAQKAQNAVDKMKAIRAKGGGSSEIIKSKEYQQMMQLVTKVDLENAVAMGLGAISADDFTHLKNLRGGADATSFIYDAMPGLEAMAQGFADDVNIDMRGQEYTGDDQWNPTRKNYSVALERPSEELLGTAEDPVPEFVRDDPHERAKYIQNTAENLGVQAERKERRGLDPVDRIDRLPDYLTPDEKVKLAAPLVASTQSVSGRIEAIRKAMGVDGMTKEQRSALSKDPAVTKRIESFQKQLQDSGAFKGHADLDVYRIITGQKKGAK
jgi:hypothetical protein